MSGLWGLGCPWGLVSGKGVLPPLMKSLELLGGFGVLEARLWYNRPGSWKDSREGWALRTSGLGQHNELVLLTTLLYLKTWSHDVPQSFHSLCCSCWLRVSFKMLCRKQQAPHSRAFSHFFFFFFSQSFRVGIRTFFKPHCPRLDSQEEVGGSLEDENTGPNSGMK